jgi:hypothetical protein
MKGAAENKYKTKASSNTENNKSSLRKKGIRLAMTKVYSTEKLYYYKEKEYAEMAIGCDAANLKLCDEVNSLEEELIRIEENLRAQLQEDGSWKAKLFVYLWNSLKASSPKTILWRFARVLYR